MKLLGYDVPLGMSVTEHSPDMIHSFVEEGFTHFEVGIPETLPEKRTNETPSCRGMEEELVAQKSALVAAIEREKLRVWSVHLPFGAGWDVAHYDERERDDVVESLKKVINLTAKWRPRVYVLHGCLEPVAPQERPVRIARSIQSMRELDAHCRKYGARIALEDLPRSCLANSSVETRAMALAADVPVCFDVNHLLGDSHADFLSALAANCITTHLSDYDGQDERHWLPGEGIVPWKKVFVGLMEAGYRGPFLFELRKGEKGVYGAKEVLGSFKKALGE